MSKKLLPDKSIKSVCSVTSLCKDLQLSRAQFYNLQKKNIFPPSLIDKRTGRPYFDINLQKICHQIKMAGIGFNGEPYLFYSPRNKSNHSRKKSKNKSHLDKKYADIAATLEQMGLTSTDSQVAEAIQELYPEGIESQMDEGSVIRELFRYLKDKM